MASCMRPEKKSRRALGRPPAIDGQWRLETERVSDRPSRTKLDTVGRDRTVRLHIDRDKRILAQGIDDVRLDVPGNLPRDL